MCLPNIVSPYNAACGYLSAILVQVKSLKQPSMAIIHCTQRQNAAGVTDSNIGSFEAPDEDGSDTYDWEKQNMLRLLTGSGAGKSAVQICYKHA